MTSKQLGQLGKIENKIFASPDMISNENILNISKDKNYSDNFEDYVPPDLDESLATLREQQNYNFDPHNYQSYYNNIQIVGNQNFASDYKNIYKDKENFNILKVNPSVTALDCNLNNINNCASSTRFSFNNNSPDSITGNNELKTPNKNIVKKKSEADELDLNRMASSNIKKIERDEKLRTVRTDSIKEVMKQASDNKVYKEDKDDKIVENFDKREKVEKKINFGNNDNNIANDNNNIQIENENNPRQSNPNYVKSASLPPPTNSNENSPSKPLKKKNKECCLIL